MAAAVADIGLHVPWNGRLRPVIGIPISGVGHEVTRLAGELTPGRERLAVFTGAR